jgi:hypothetical protein
MTAFRSPSEVISKGLWAGCCRDLAVFLTTA